MEKFKSKSLSPEYTDLQIKKECFVTQFISFEAAITLFREKYTSMNLKDKPIGYRVTNEGIEILLK